MELQLEGKYTECPNPQKSENHACDRQSGLNDSAPRNHIPGCLRQSHPLFVIITERVTGVLIKLLICKYILRAF